MTYPYTSVTKLLRTILYSDPLYSATTVHIFMFYKFRYLNLEYILRQGDTSRQAWPI